MSLGTLDRRTVFMLIVSVAAILILRFVVLSGRQAQAVVAPADSVPLAERRLERMRQVAATVPAKEELFKQASAELQSREKGMLKAETGAQAQAQLQALIHTIGAANGIDARGMDDARVKPMANDYGEASVTVTFTCAIEQLVNFLAALANEPELLSTNQIQITGGSDKKKNIQVRLSLSGVVPKKLAQEKKGAGAF